MIIRYQTFYHFYNHAISNESLFVSDRNYDFFYRQYFKYLNPLVKTFAFCLMPNHFHFLIKVRDKKEITEYFKTSKTPVLEKIENLAGFENHKINLSDKNLAGLENLQGLNDQLLVKAHKQFGNFFNSYAKAFNKVYYRKGKLFRNHMNLKEVDNANYLKNLIHYIHLNPVIHGFVNDPADWKYSSYFEYINNKSTMLERADVMDLFGTEVNFYTNHKKKIDEGLLNELEY
jgi:putative transposase